MVLLKSWLANEMAIVMRGSSGEENALVVTGNGPLHWRNSYRGIEAALAIKNIVVVASVAKKWRNRNRYVRGVKSRGG